jgi:hypothetical protein
MTSVADYNNNPGNLKPKGFTYKGQIGLDDQGFAIFENKDAGRNALMQDIRAKQSQGLNNPNAFIDKYAPAMKENPEEGRENYKMRMAQHLGLKSTTDPFPKGSEEKIADLITQFESGSSPAPAGKEESGAKKPFEDYKPRVITQDDTPPPPLEKNRTEKAIDYATDVGGAIVDKVVESPELPAAAGLGLIKGTLEKVLQNPEKHLVDIKKGETTPEQVRAASDKAKDAQTRIGEIKQLASERAPIDVDSLQREFDLRKFSNELMDEDLRSAQKELKALPKTYVPPVEPVAAETAEQILARTTPGASGAQKWVEAMSDDVPTALAEKARNMRGDNPKGGQAIIDAQAAAVQRLESMGLGGFPLDPTKTLAVPTKEAARLEQELAAKQAQEAAEQSARAQQVEAQRLAAEADLQRQRQAAEQRVEQARKSKISSGERASDARKAANTARQQVAAQAKSDAGRLDTATINARTAQQTAKEAAEAQPGALTMATREAGRRFSEKLPVIGNVMGAAGATLSVDEAVKRANEGDISGAVLGTIEAALNAASIAPPTSPLGLAVKGVGTVGSLGMIPVWLLHDYIGKKGVFAPKKEPQKARGGLTLMR